jgi:hypothetical protein
MTQWMLLLGIAAAVFVLHSSSVNTPNDPGRRLITFARWVELSAHVNAAMKGA